MKIEDCHSYGGNNVEYYGIKFLLADEFKYVATEPNGEVFGFVNEPKFIDGRWMHMDMAYDFDVKRQYAYLFTIIVDGELEDSHTTLKKLEDIYIYG